MPPESELEVRATRKGTACQRCRRRKNRCDGAEPACSNCAKANVVCIRAIVQTDYVHQLEQRIDELEHQLRGLSRNGSPHSNIGNASYVPAVSSLRPDQEIIQNSAATAPAADDGIDPDRQPLAHDVGLLALGNTGDPRYLGPSSGVSFARMIYAAAPQTQGLPNSAVSSMARQPMSGLPNVECAKLPEEADMRYFVNAYIDIWHTFYPFLDEDDLRGMLDRVCHRFRQSNSGRAAPESGGIDAMDYAQCFLVLSLGARILESELDKDFHASGLFATAMQYVDSLQLHDSIRGVQTMLLLVLSSYSFQEGLNAWFLLSTIIASCLDLGLQRRQLKPGEALPQNLRYENLRSGVFWSAYSLERTLSVVLGRPLTLRDEALDIRFPGEQGSRELENDALAVNAEPLQKRTRPEKTVDAALSFNPDAFRSARFSFRFDRIVAEIKLMVYRVANYPQRFPWPADISSWQTQVYEACKIVLGDAEASMRRHTGRHAEHTMHSLTLKYHQCLLILYRPSPAFPEPTAMALHACFHSATEVLRINAEMNRFAKLTSSWLTAHTVFTSGIAMLYCLWISTSIRSKTSVKELLRYAEACTTVLQKLEATWSVAHSARTKFERLVHLTVEAWKRDQLGVNKARISEQNGSSAEPFQPNDPTPMANSANDPVLSGYPDSLWDGPIGGDHPSLFIGELGDMSSWFDLSWLDEMSFTGDPNLE